jgi:hypothetical protein
MDKKWIAQWAAIYKIRAYTVSGLKRNVCLAVDWNIVGKDLWWVTIMAAIDVNARRKPEAVT